MNFFIPWQYSLRKLMWVMKSIILGNETTKPSREEVQSINSKDVERLPKVSHFKALSYERDDVSNEVIVESERKKP